MPFLLRLRWAHLTFEAHLSSDVRHKASPRRLQRARLSFPRAQTHLSSSEPKCVLTPAPLVRLLPDSATPAVLLHSYHLSVECGSNAEYTLTRVFAEWVNETTSCNSYILLLRPVLT